MGSIGKLFEAHWKCIRHCSNKWNRLLNCSKRIEHVFVNCSNKWNQLLNCSKRIEQTYKTYNPYQLKIERVAWEGPTLKTKIERPFAKVQKPKSMPRLQHMANATAQDAGFQNMDWSALMKARKYTRVRVELWEMFHKCWTSIVCAYFFS